MLAALLATAAAWGAAPPPGGYIGSAGCGACHAEALGRWASSLHAAAMVSAATGPVPRHAFALNPRLAESPRPAWRKGGPWVLLAPGSTPRAVPVPYVLGGRHVAQLLAAFPRGKLQAAALAYDLGSGQWFDLHSGEGRKPADWGHWTSRGMTANAQCLPCHTTGYEKRYSPATDSYGSRWAEAGVGCESCHGPGAAHAEARRPSGAPGPADPYASAGTSLGERKKTLDLCAPCHSRRVEIVPRTAPGEPFLDHYVPELLDSAAFHPDGQLKDEGFEWAPFSQSLMGSVGITCLDCHRPHRGAVRPEGNALCLRCHPPALSRPGHTHHRGGSPGARCTDCHMPRKVFLRRDPRHDHSFGLPDPEATVEIGIPNACTGCHTDKTPQWAAAKVRAWYGPSPRLLARRRLTAVLAAARRGEASAAAGLIEVLDHGPDRVRRASAARLLGELAAERRQSVLRALVRAAKDKDPLVRAGAVAALGKLDAAGPATAALLRAAARDGVRLVRLEAAWALRRTHLHGLPLAERRAVRSAWREWLAWQRDLADTPEASYDRALFFTARGKPLRAIAAYRAALALWPEALQPRQNLAMLLARMGRRAEAEAELRRLLDTQPGWPGAPFALGLLYGEGGKWEEAARMLERAVGLDPTYPRALYNLGLAYARLGRRKAALATLERAAAEDSGSRADALDAMVGLASKGRPARRRRRVRGAGG